MDVGKGRVIGKRASNFQQRRSLSVEAAFGSLPLHSFARIGCIHGHHIICMHRRKPLGTI